MRQLTQDSVAILQTLRAESAFWTFLLTAIKNTLLLRLMIVVFVRPIGNRKHGKIEACIYEINDRKVCYFYCFIKF